MLGKKSKISTVELLKNSLVSQDFSEAISEFSSNDFVSPFLEFAKLESEEEATRKAQELLDVIEIISELNTDEASEVVDLLFRNRRELCENVLHALIWDARFSLANQLAVIGVLFNSSTFRDRLLNEKDIKDETPLDVFKGVLDKDFNGFEQIGLLALDLGIKVSDFLRHAMRHKNNDLVAAIYKHPKYKATLDEKIMYLVYRDKFEEIYPPFNSDKELLKPSLRHPKNMLLLISSALITKSSDKVKLTGYLMDASERGCTETVKALIEIGADINELMTTYPIHLAVANGHFETVEALITAGADVNAIDRYNRIPLHLAANRGFTKALDILTKNGADVNLKNPYDGKTALHMAARNNHLEAVVNLIQKGADVYSEDCFSKTPLHTAAFYGSTETIIALIQMGSKVNLKDYSGDTPLHKAAYFGHTETARALIDRGAEISSTNFNRATPLHLAALCGRAETVKLLIERGAVPTEELRKLVSEKHKSGGYNKESYSEILELFDEYFKQQELKAALSTQGSTSSNMLSSAAVTDDPNGAIVSLTAGVTAMFINQLFESKSTETGKGV